MSVFVWLMVWCRLWKCCVFCFSSCYSVWGLTWLNGLTLCQMTELSMFRLFGVVFENEKQPLFCFFFLPRLNISAVLFCFVFFTYRATLLSVFNFTCLGKRVVETRSLEGYEIFQLLGCRRRRLWRIVLLIREKFSCDFFLANTCAQIQTDGAGIHVQI